MMIILVNISLNTYPHLPVLVLESKLDFLFQFRRRIRLLLSVHFFIIVRQRLQVKICVKNLFEKLWMRTPTFRSGFLAGEAKIGEASTRVLLLVLSNCNMWKTMMTMIIWRSMWMTMMKPAPRSLCWYSPTLSWSRLASCCCWWRSRLGGYPPASQSWSPPCWASPPLPPCPPPLPQCACAPRSSRP